MRDFLLNGIRLVIPHLHDATVVRAKYIWCHFTQWTADKIKRIELKRAFLTITRFMLSCNIFIIWNFMTLEIIYNWYIEEKVFKDPKLKMESKLDNVALIFNRYYLLLIVFKNFFECTCKWIEWLKNYMFFFVACHKSTNTHQLPWTWCHRWAIIAIRQITKILLTLRTKGWKEIS